MAYDEDLADRLRAMVAGAGATEKRMFGGLAFLVDGHLAICAAHGGGLLVRVDPADIGSLMAQDGVRRFEMRGRAMDGWLAVDADAVTTDDELRSWVDRGVTASRRSAAERP